MEKFGVLVQGFYGNQTGLEVTEETFDALMLGHVGSVAIDPDRDKVDRSIIRVPNTDNLVIVYNKYMEEGRLNQVKKFIKTLHDRTVFRRFNPTVVIPELGVVLYGRCFVCRMNEDGTLAGFNFDEDYDKVQDYLAV